MITLRGAIQCDAEIGSVRAGWHNCGRKAVCESRTERYSTYLHWCEQHRDRATVPGRTLIREIPNADESSAPLGSLL